MDSSSENSQGDGGSPKKKQNKRGITKMKSVTKMRDTGNKYSIQWNKKGQPIGQNASKLMSYIGHCTRNRVSIAFPTWRDVPRDTKLMIAEQVMRAFELLETRVRWIVRIASERFREFKGRLTRLYLYTEDGEIRTEPPDRYEFIEHYDWTEFVNQRETPEFQARSEKNRELAKLNEYPFMGSRKGYAGIEQDIIIERNLDPSTEISRAELWKAGRLGMNGKVCTQKAKEIADKIDELNEQVASGKLKISGRRDTLALALGKDEHPGRVRGVGKGVTIKQYFPTSRDQVSIGESCYSTDVKELQDEVQELRRMVKLLAQNQELNLGSKGESVPAKEVPTEKALEKEAPAISTTKLQEKDVSEQDVPRKDVPKKDITEQNIVKGAFTTKQARTRENQSLGISDFEAPTTVNLEGNWNKCQLFWPTLKTRVATRSLFIPSTNTPIVLHCKPLPAKCAKVIIDIALIESSSLPYPMEEAAVVKDAIGIPIAWPKAFILPFKAPIPVPKAPMPAKKPNNSAVSISKQDVNPPQAFEKSNTQTVYRYMKKMSKLLPLMDSDRVIASISMPQKIVNYEHEISIWREDIKRWLLKKTIDSCHVSIYMRYLLERKCPKNLDMFRFLCPQRIAATKENGLSLDDQVIYISSSMIREHGHQKLFFAPYNSDGHWMLAVIYPRQNIVYWLDSLHDSVKEEFKEVIEKSIAKFFDETKGSKLNMNTKWCSIQCPLQPNAIDCGYYILRFMREIIEQRTLSIPIEYFTRSTRPYTSDQLDELREEWLEFVDYYIDW